MKLLIVVDMQNDFVTGSLANPDAQAIVPRVVEKVIKYTDDPHGTTLFTRDSHTDDYLETQEGINLPIPHCIVGTNGWRIIPELEHLRGDVVDKPTFGFYDLAGTVNRIGEWKGEEITEVEFIGVCTDICVISNALLLKAFKPELKISCDSSCCAGLTPEKHAAALEVMKSCQINVY